MLLRLTSPHTKGRNVRLAQTLLRRNRFKRDFHPGPVDGEFGPATAAAAKRAKHFLGYPKRMINGTVGERLLAYLRGPKAGGAKLPKTYLVRAKVRQKLAAKHDSKREAIIRIARSQIGQTEHPAGSNCTKFGPCEYWCADFVSWVLQRAGVKFRYAYVPAVYEDARRGRNGLRITHSPEPGDLVLFKFGHPWPGHIGIFERWTGKFGSFDTIEGNTSAAGSQDHGGMVLPKSRDMYQVYAFVKVVK